MRLSQGKKTETGLFNSHSVHFCTLVYTQVIGPFLRSASFPLGVPHLLRPGHSAHLQSTHLQGSPFFPQPHSCGMLAVGSFADVVPAMFNGLSRGSSYIPM